MGVNFGYVLLAVLLILNGRGSAFPARGDLEDTPTSGFDYDQYKFAQSANNILVLDRANENHQKWNDGVDFFSGRDLIKPNLVQFQQISGETMEKICQDFDLNIFIKSEGKLIDCSKFKQNPVLLDSEELLQQNIDERIKRDAPDEELDGSGDMPIDDKPKENVPSVLKVSVPNIAEETKSNLNKTEEKGQKTQRPTEKTNPSVATESVSKPSVEAEAKIEKTNKLEIPVNKPIITENANKTQPHGQSEKATNGNSATTKQVTKDISSVIPTNKPQSTSDVASENPQISSAIAPKIEQSKAIAPTKSNDNVSKETKDKVAVPITGKKDETSVAPIPNPNTNTTDTEKKESVSSKGHDKPEIHRKGKHMDLNTQQIEGLQEPPSIQSAAGNEESEANISNAEEELGAKNDKKQALEETEPKAGTSTKKTANNSGIIWFIFGGVVIIGAALMGYKMMKKRKRQQQAGNCTKRTANEPVANSNASNREQEMKPLMNDVEGKPNNTIKIVDETREAKENNTTSSQQKNENVEEKDNQENSKGDQPFEAVEPKEMENGDIIEEDSPEKR